MAPPAAFGYINLGVIQQDQDKARELLAEAGYPDGFEMNFMCTNVYNKGVQAGEIAVLPPRRTARTATTTASAPMPRWASCSTAPP